MEGWFICLRCSNKMGCIDTDREEMYLCADCELKDCPSMLVILRIIKVCEECEERERVN